MSNHLAIATVSYTLAEMIQPALQAVVPSATVRVGRPESAERRGTPFVGANLYLYRVEPNGSFRNADLTTRDGAGTLLQRPRAALDLYYLISFYGDDLQLETQRMLGRLVALLHARPVLTRERIREAIDHNAQSATPFLAHSDLDRQTELVRLTPQALSLEELSKLWTVFFQVTHALSVAYKASVLLIEAEGTPRTAPQVTDVRVYPARDHVSSGTR